MIANNPFQQVPFNLMRHRPFSLLVTFEKKDKSPVDLTGASLRMVVSQTRRKGGAVVATATYAHVAAELGVGRLDLQGDEMDMVPGTYVTSITLISEEGFESTVIEGEVEVEHNPDPAVPVDHDPVFPPLGLTVTMRDQQKVTVRVDHAPDSVLLDIVQQAIDAASEAALQAALAAAAAAASDGSAATAAALEAAVSAAAAQAAAAQAAADAAAALAASGGEDAAAHAAAAAISAANAAASAAAAAAEQEAAAYHANIAQENGNAASGSADAASGSADAAAASAAAAAASAASISGGSAADTVARDAAAAAQADADAAVAAASAAAASAAAAQAYAESVNADMDSRIEEVGEDLFVNQRSHTDAIHVHGIRVMTQSDYNALAPGGTNSDTLYVIRG